MSYFALVLSLLASLTIVYKWFDIFIEDLNEGLEEIIFKFVDDTKIGVLAKMTDYKIKIP